MPVIELWRNQQHAAINMNRVHVSWFGRARKTTYRLRPGTWAWAKRVRRVWAWIRELGAARLGLDVDLTQLGLDAGLMHGLGLDSRLDLDARLETPDLDPGLTLGIEQGLESG